MFFDDISYWFLSLHPLFYTKRDTTSWNQLLARFPHRTHLETLFEIFSVSMCSLAYVQLNARTNIKPVFSVKQLLFNGSDNDMTWFQALTASPSTAVSYTQIKIDRDGECEEQYWRLLNPKSSTHCHPCSLTIHNVFLDAKP